MLNRRMLLGTVIGTVGLSAFKANFDTRNSGWQMSWHATFDGDLRVNEFWAPRLHVTPEQLPDGFCNLGFKTETMVPTVKMSLRGITLWGPDGLPVISNIFSSTCVMVNDSVCVTYELNRIPSHRINDQQWIANMARDMFKSRTDHLRQLWAETNHGA